MDVNIQSEVGVCNQYKPNNSRETEEVSVVISPVKIESKNDGAQLKVISGCNLWRGCHNADCYFALAARTGPKIEKKEAP